MTRESRGYPIKVIQSQKVVMGYLWFDTHVIVRRIRDKQARREPINIENFVLDTIDELILYYVRSPLGNGWVAGMTIKEADL